jgi:hypothetical protein
MLSVPCGKLLRPGGCLVADVEQVQDVTVQDALNNNSCGLIEDCKLLLAIGKCPFRRHYQFYATFLHYIILGIKYLHSFGN